MLIAVSAKLIRLCDLHQSRDWLGRSSLKYNGYWTLLSSTHVALCGYYCVWFGGRCTAAVAGSIVVRDCVLQSWSAIVETLFWYIITYLLWFTAWQCLTVADVWLSADPLSTWSADECANFVSGLRQYGKDFYLIHLNKVMIRYIHTLLCIMW